VPEAIMNSLFRNLKEAGQLLAGRLSRQGFAQPVVRARSASAVPVAFEVALALDAPLGLIGTGDVAREPTVEFAGRTLIVVDHSLFCGSGLRAELDLLRLKGPRRIVVAVPVAAPEAIRELERAADCVVALLRPERLGDAGPFYEEFVAPSAEDVSTLLARRR
jgi:predicted phosphoribosyltransferase